MNVKKVKYSVADHIATITLNDPKSLNAFGEELATDLLEALENAEGDKEVRVIVLQGSNGNFSSGGNIKEMLSVGTQADDLSKKLEQLVNYAGIISRKLRAIDKPIIAKLQGAVAGAGCNLALTCDFRIASEEAQFIQSFVHIGLVPDAGGIYLLNELIGASKATELTMLGEKITAQRAFDFNLLYKVTATQDIDEAVSQLANRLVQLPATALATIKNMVNTTAFSQLSDALDSETKNQARLARTAEFSEGVNAFIEKRKPNYLNLHP